MARNAYNTPAWRRVRLEVLERDGYRCKIGGPSCKHQATQVDHIVPIKAGGAPYDPENLRASCAPCNSMRANQRSENWRRSSTRIMLVEGPPCAGKSTYVDEHKKSGDLVVDYDILAGAMGVSRQDEHLHGAVMAARNALLGKLRRGEIDTPRAWIVSANPNALNLFPFHEVVTLDPGLEECLARCDRVGRPPRVRQVVRDWYRERMKQSSSEEASRNW